ncbi:hypothetical protein P8935_09695 [Telmatobacter sp. DSM 110680]|uniref:Uncharacterized protein n=1 Tax=Telmatobacter sp. DSM 110680 TaxID=3036704 RepID=A0AAU7DQL0_9BACT
MVKRFLGIEARGLIAHVFRVLTFAVMLHAAAQAQLFGHHPKDAKDASPADSVNREQPASQPAAFSIPVEPLGFFAPGAIYQGQRESLVSLDFLDEDHLLFTFHAPGLMRRRDNASASDERQIRAVVLALPSGTVNAEALWTLHDRGRYLWMLNDGHFLLRNQNDLQLGEASLELKPSLHFEGPVLWLELDPAQDLVATDSREPVGTKPQTGSVPSPGTASAWVTSDEVKSYAEPDIVLRIVRRATGQVMLVSRTRTTVHLPINSDGFVESLRGKGHEWVLNLDSFKGGSRVIGKLDSMCAPSVEFVSNPEVLVTTCNPDNSRWMVAMSTDGKRLWNVVKPPTQIWPRLYMAPNGLRLARETLVVTHPIDTFSPLSFDDVKGQLVEVYDAITGKVNLTAPASPILDGGGNVAISPSARRVAILDAGAIQVYELPPTSPGLPAGQ